MQESLKKLAKILNSSKGYISHMAALFLHGLIEEPPPNFVVVASCRRKPISLNTFKANFVYHKPGRPREHTILDCEGELLPVATVAQALVDMVTDCKCQTDLDTLARCFWALPYDPAEIRRLAAQNGYSTEKKAVFWCLWAGRGSADKLLKGFDRRPVKFFPRYRGIQLWEGSLQAFYPESLLSPLHATTQPLHNFENTDWIELRLYKNFIDYCKKERWVPFPGDSRKKQLSMLHDFFAGELSTQIAGNATDLMRQLNLPRSTHTTFTNRLPQMFLDWVRTASDFPDCAISQVKAVCRQMLASDQPEQWEIAFIQKRTDLFQLYTCTKWGNDLE